MAYYYNITYSTGNVKVFLGKIDQEKKYVESRVIKKIFYLFILK